MTDLKDLEPLSKRLNAASDELTHTLQVIQDKLNALGIGLEVWLERETFDDSDWSDILDRHEEPTGSREYWAKELGYGRHGDGWSLLVRSRRHVEGTDERGFASTDIYEGSQPVPLLKASREIRTAAVPLIPELIDDIKTKAAAVIGRVEQAKKIAESLK